VQISISARHGQLNNGTQDKIREKVEKLRRYFDRLTAIVVTVDLEHADSPKVEVRASAEHTEDFVAADNGSNVLAALDSAAHKVEQQLRKHKDKRRTGHRSSGHKQQEPPIDAT
jgi:putative sigma-54 modulation protein